LARREQLEISKEVKGHFDKAVTQAEKKFEEGDEKITQSAITKLKLGLAGTLNDISQYNNDIALAQLRLEKYLGVQWASGVDISGPEFKPVNFPHKTVDEYMKSHSSGSNTKSGSTLYDLKEAIIEVNKAREQLTLAGKNRKMTRALLVTEAANYDFGIGDEADLFEALIIYTRVLVGYYEALHTFNVAVYRFHSINNIN
jgi:outer membrane protein TolC